MAVLVIDQIIKVCVKTGMYLGERIEITSWFSLVFVENNGMAFGWELWGGKLFLTLFRIVAVILIGWFIHSEIKHRRPTGYIVCLTLIAAGAAGNIIDCLFYGLIFNTPPYPEVADFQRMGHAYVDAHLLRSALRVLLPYLQLCRCSHLVRHRRPADILS